MRRSSAIRRFTGSPSQLLIKTIVTALTFVGAIKLFHIDWTQVYSSTLGLGEFGAMVLFVMMLMVPNALRWHGILLRLGICLSVRRVIVVTFGAMFFNQILPGGIGGDIYRVVALRPLQISLWRVFLSVWSDRALSVAATTLLIIASLFIFPAESGQPHSFYLLVAAAVLSLVLVGIFYGGELIAWPMFWMGRRLPHLKVKHIVLRAARGICEATRAARLAIVPPIVSIRNPFLYAMITQLAIVALGYWIARGLSASVAFWSIAATMPAIVLLSMIPISLGGWGVREFASVVLLAAVGLSAEKALAVSITFGVVNLLGGIVPGALVLLCNFISANGSKETGADGIVVAAGSRNEVSSHPRIIVPHNAAE